jgi:hypothetical protein
MDPIEYAKNIEIYMIRMQCIALIRVRRVADFWTRTRLIEFSRTRTFYFLDDLF